MKLLIARPRLTLAAWLGFWGVVALLTHVPLPRDGAPRIPHLDKVVHAGMYFTLTFLNASRLWAHERKVSIRKLVLWGFFYAAYGVIDELTQPWTRRTADLDDWLADAVGIIAATWYAAIGLRNPRLSELGGPDGEGAKSESHGEGG